MTYKEKLKDPKWLSLRNKILEERGHNCQICNSDIEITIHHGYYKPLTEPWEYEEGSLWVLCWSCHKIVQLELLRIHRRIGIIHPNEISSYSGKIISTINLKEEEDFIKEAETILEEERKILSELYMDYSVSITSCSDLCPSVVPEIADALSKEFPGINISIEYHEENEIDGLYYVNGTNENIVDQIKAWLGKHLNK